MTIFEDVKRRVTMRDAIDYLRLKAVEQKGDQFRFKCPTCTDNDGRSLAVNLTNGFTCYAAKPKKSGNDCIALVAHVLNISQTEAAKVLAKHFLGSSTEPERKSTGAGRGSDTSGACASPPTTHPVIDMLGIDPNMLDAIGGGYCSETERIEIPLRTPGGDVSGTVGIATRADQSPLLLFSERVTVQKETPDELRKLFRVV